MRHLVLASTVLMTIASAAAAQSSGPAPSTTQPSTSAIGSGAVPNALTAPNARSTGACTADAGCATFPLTPLGAASPSLTPRLSPVIGAQPNQSGSALTAPPLVATPNPTGARNPTGSALASPRIGATLNQPGGLDQSSAINRAGGAAVNPAAGTPATRAPSMSSNAFQSQCANSLGCDAFQGQ